MIISIISRGRMKWKVDKTMTASALLCNKRRPVKVTINVYGSHRTPFLKTFTEEEAPQYLFTEESWKKTFVWEGSVKEKMYGSSIVTKPTKSKWRE